MSEYDPRLVAPTCLYLASKAEESTVQAKLLVFYIRKICKYLLLKIIDYFSNFYYDLLNVKPSQFTTFLLQIRMRSIDTRSKTYWKWK